MMPGNLFLLKERRSVLSWALLYEAGERSSIVWDLLLYQRDIQYSRFDRIRNKTATSCKTNIQA